MPERTLESEFAWGRFTHFLQDAWAKLSRVDIYNLLRPLACVHAKAGQRESPDPQSLYEADRIAEPSWALSTAMAEQPQ
jgi:hypothetical protein